MAAVTFLVVSVSALGSSTVLGQEHDRHRLEWSGADGDIVPVHVTDQLLASPEGQAALAEYRERKEQGMLPAGKTTDAGTPFVTEQSFRVYNFREDKYETIDFTLAVEESRFNLWVETTQLAVSPEGVVTEGDTEALRKAFADSTGPASYDPDLGIVEINELVFGNPPNVDGDGRTDVLIHDIQDSYDPRNGQYLAILGYFDPSDLIRPNSADIIHIDVMPGMYTPEGERRLFSRVEQTLAHEYEHLIFRGEGGSAPTFVNEGLAEWAEVVNGYTARGINYTSKQSELSGALLGFRNGMESGVQYDYQRAGLFTNFVAERTSIVETGSITRTSATSAHEYYQALLGGTDPAEGFRQLVHDFHVANAINDRSVTAAYGHERIQYQNVLASGYPVFDGAVSTGSSGTFTLEPGGVAYVAVTDPTNFSASIIDASDTDDVRSTVIAERSDGTTQTYSLFAGGEGVQLSSDHERIIILFMNDDFESASSLSVSYIADWQESQPLDTEVEKDELHPQIVTLEQNYPNPFHSTTTIRFSLPETRQVYLLVFDMLGRQIATLADGTLPAGRHEVEFSAGHLPGGVYLYRLNAGASSQTRTMMVR